MRGALEGIKVLDLSRYAPGWYGTMILGDHGADVLKIEGAPSDLIVPEFTSPDSPYDPLNRNKRSIVLNLKNDEARKVFYQLAEKADVVVEGFRPGVTKRLKVDYETLKSINDRIIYCSLTGYGQDGPNRQLAGHDLNYISQGGALGIMRRPDAIPGNILGDFVSGGMQTAIGVLIALQARHATGRGQYVDIAITDGVVSLIAPYMAKYLETGRMPDLEVRATVGGTAYYNVYETKDGKFISIASGEQSFFANLCKILECEQFIPSQLDGARQAEIKAFFTKKFLTKTRDEWFDVLSGQDTAVGKVLSPAEVTSDPHLIHRQMIVEMDHPTAGKVKQTGVPVKLSDTPGGIRGFSPKPGEHTREVLRQLGYNEEEIMRLKAAGAVSMPDTA
jgi:crotonobetainyl-CoA:carnitine CoA-transferase CaiB-like acyl-CoA transferase